MNACKASNLEDSCHAVGIGLMDGTLIVLPRRMEAMTVFDSSTIIHCTSLSLSLSSYWIAKPLYPSCDQEWLRNSLICVLLHHMWFNVLTSLKVLQLVFFYCRLAPVICYLPHGLQSAPAHREIHSSFNSNRSSCRKINRGPFDLKLLFTKKQHWFIDLLYLLLLKQKKINDMKIREMSPFSPTKFFYNTLDMGFFRDWFLNLFLY